jgi:hypothetical protein
LAALVAGGLAEGSDPAAPGSAAAAAKGWGWAAAAGSGSAAVAGLGWGAAEVKDLEEAGWAAAVMDSG